MSLCNHYAHQHIHKEENIVPCLDHVCRSSCSLPLELDSAFVFDKTVGVEGRDREQLLWLSQSGFELCVQ